MNSISTSDKLVDIQDLDVYYEYDEYLSFNLRDRFVNIVKSPMTQIFNKKKINKVLIDFDLTVSKGDRVGILGVNGAGKTTLCRAICGMYYPNKGKISVTKNIRAIFDTSVGIVPELTGRENARLLSLLIYPDSTSQERAKYVDDAIQFSELGEFIDTPFQSYSKGMQARLCLSLVSCKESDLLILDEVYDGADEFFQEKIANRVLGMIDKSGGVLFVSHSVDNIRKSCNRVIVLDKCSKVFDGNVEDGINFYQGLYRKNNG
ncbi:ABC transporter ATP-binding protein [Bacteriovorax sp. Seq25_V]|uniref:ABC transporter ATP-binding protein n=1 Tax=Bacteriovorax sp. Seq25_V TaxID=1201288 RepID=UPI00038A3F4F|nr:ATP-binding cassette domain-containing protein [Bacteriovorax sp. Seq25_V]EQC47899.1 ABC transporter, ATP-binding protein [Bacteriovorax sp. Seq25_V]